MYLTNEDRLFTVGSLVPRFLLLYILLYHFTTRLAFVAQIARTCLPWPAERL